ncbi:DNA-binding protein Alba [Candidatus Pacearchaeota archaeon]|nr:DNA-binding protein Alba [Candidatus Pacearchaeota archaeon]
MDDSEKKNDNVVFIGSKPFMNYITSVVIQFTSKNRDEVIVKARGKWISRAVDVVERVRKRFLKDKNIQIKHVRIDSDEVENKEGKKINVSLIEITLGK